MSPFPIADFIHVLIVYLIIGLILWLPPLIVPQWKSLVKYLDKKEIMSKKRFEILLIILSVSIIIIAFILISLHNQRLFPIEFENMSSYFHIFATFTFLLLPVSMGIIVTITYIRNSVKLKLGEFFILLFAFSALALAGSLYHDFLWCGTRTNWYTTPAFGGYDFDVWNLLVGVQSNDYRLLGACQGVLALILIVYSIILLWKFNSFLEIKLNMIKKIQIIVFSFFAVIFLGFFLFIIDYGSLFDFNQTVHALFLGIPLICLLFHQMGKILIRNTISESRENELKEK
ncbi:MAG: hypothetical protein HWN65_04470 [Candidatus Helarchaeota archaeon]|nr:hypothetical protein [Candidatus Helarchaeota archaeon]